MSRITALRLFWAWSVCLTACSTQNVVQLDRWGTDAIRVRIAPPGGSIVEPPLMALLPGQPATAPTASSMEVTNGNLNIVVDVASGGITATRVSDGAILLRTIGVSWGTAAPGSRASSVSAQITFQGHGASEAIYGLGEHRSGTVNQMPFFRLFQDSQYYPISHGSDAMIPYFASSLGYAFLWNLPSYGWCNLTQTELAWFSNATLNIDFWITTTPAAPPAALASPYALMLRNMVDVVGHAPPQPWYSTGFIQCKDRYRNQSQVLDVARGYVTRGLPISVIVIDWHHWVQQGDWSLNPACWPDPQGMVDELASLGIELMITFWPFQTPPSQHWNQYVDNGYLATNLTGGSQPLEAGVWVYDATSVAARNATFWDWYAGYGQYGVKSIWMDAAEPERSTYNFGEFHFELGTDTEVGMAWTQQHVKTFAEGLPQIGINASDYFVLPRHVWAGSWRYSAALWSGDIQSAFSELQMQITVAQGVAMSGQVLWTTDIGGYWGGDPTDPVFQDLIVRWMQFGAFCPLFRLHGHRAGGPPANDECLETNGDNEVWNLAADDAHYNAMAAVMRLRESLRGYVAQINLEASETGMPMLRPMILAFPEDPVCATPAVENQFMFGPDWLVAPVSTYLAANWSVYLPLISVNETWVYWWGQVEYEGGQRITLSTPISEFPLFYRRPRPVIPPPTLFNLTSLFSASRLDQVLCLDAACYSANAPGNEGDYAIQRVEGVGVQAAAGSVILVNGTQFDLQPLTLWFSSTHNDNFVTANTSAPDDTYTVTFPNGYTLTQPAPGTVALQVWQKAWNATKYDFATVASAAGVEWAQSNGYTYRYDAGFVFTA